MKRNLAGEVAALKKLSLEQLRSKYAEALGESTRNSNRIWLVKRIAWRWQALAEGDLSQRAQRRALELANDADVRLSPPRLPRVPKTPSELPSANASSPPREDRLPQSGTILTRRYKGALLQIKVLAQGFEWQGGLYRSLSAVARAITGSHCNGFHFFRLVKEGASR